MHNPDLLTGLNDYYQIIFNLCGRSSIWKSLSYGSALLGYVTGVCFIRVAYMCVYI